MQHAWARKYVDGASSYESDYVWAHAGSTVIDLAQLESALAPLEDLGFDLLTNDEAVEEAEAFAAGGSASTATNPAPSPEPTVTSPSATSSDDAVDDGIVEVPLSVACDSLNSGTMPTISVDPQIGISSGDAVVVLTTLLTWLGYADTGAKVFDESYEQSVMAFQAAFGLEADGVVGTETWQVIAMNACD